MCRQIELWKLDSVPVVLHYSGVFMVYLLLRLDAEQTKAVGFGSPAAAEDDGKLTGANASAS